MPRFPGLGRGRGSSFKYHFSVEVASVTLRDGVSVPGGASFRVVWKRGDKVASTRELAPEGAALPFDETLALVCTMYRDTGGGAAFAAKDASFTLLQGRSDKPGTVVRQLAKATVDLSRYAAVEPTREEVRLVLLHDGVPVADMVVVVASRWLKNFAKSEGAESMVSDSASERSSPGGYSSESSAFFTDAESDAGSDAGDLRYQRDVDTDDEMDGGGGGGGGGSAAPTPRSKTSTPRKALLGLKRLGGGSYALGGGSYRAAAPASADGAMSDLQEELARMEASGREASMEAQRAEEALAALQGRWEEAQPRLALYDELCALRDRQQAELVELRAQATATKEEALAANTQLAGAQAAAAEAKSAAAAEQEKLREQLAAAATAAEAQRSRVAELEGSIAELSELAAATREEGDSKQAALRAAAKKRGDEVAAKEAAAAKEAEAAAAREAAAREEAAALRARVAEVEASEAALLTLVSRHVGGAQQAASRRLDLLLRRAQLLAAQSTDTGGRAPADERARKRAAKEATARADALFAAGRAANEVGDVWAAAALFEHSYVAAPRVAAMLSVANMALKLGETEAAATFYRHVLDGGDASEPEAAMASRKLKETDDALGDVRAAAQRAPDDGAEGGGGGGAAAELAMERRMRGRLLAEVRRLGGGGEGGAAADDASVLTLQAELLSLKHECAQLRAAAPKAAEGGAAAAAGGGPTEAELKHARAQLATALAEKAALAREVTQQHKLHKRAKAERLALKEVATRLEVQVATQQAAQQAAAAAGGGASAETDEEARFREIMKAQNEVVIELREENERLAAKIAVLEAK